MDFWINLTTTVATVKLFQVYCCSVNYTKIEKYNPRIQKKCVTLRTENAVTPLFDALLVCK